MQIVVFGRDIKIKELQLKLKNVEDITWLLKPTDFTNIKSNALIFDLDYDTNPVLLEHWQKLNNTIVVGANKMQLAKSTFLTNKTCTNNWVGMNTFNGFINKPIWELSLANKSNQNHLHKLTEMLGIDYKLVDDRVGMVTARVVLMIINEACYTVQEGTADMKAIDQAMKLGTNYPKGPFEWANDIGIIDVYETLNAIYEDTKDERYKICPLIKTHYLNGEPFLI